ncbi:MAG: Ig-like domain repeat protein [Kineosporiaceae bacterium]|nr:Ig-like domain repeat protein [Aeromicrobium sp.]
MSIKKKLVAVAVASALILGGVGAAQTAQAAPISGGSITLTPSSGNVSDQYFVTGMTVSAGAPVGYRAASSTWIFQNGVNMGGFSSLRKPATDSTTYGSYGLDGSPASLDRSISPGNPYLTNKQLTGLNFSGTPSILQTGNFELRYYYHALSTSLDLVNEPYATIALNYDSVSGAWGPVGQPAIATTVSLSASASGSAVNLGAIVKLADSSTATAAAGNVVFVDGATTVATVAVVSGAASASLTGVSTGSHNYTAQFVPTNTTFSGSTSAASTVQVGGIQQTTTTSVTVPGGIGSLSLTGVSSSVALGTAALNTTSNTLDASGTLNAIVKDTRQTDAASWSLTGQVGDFTAAGSKTISGKYLGWTPSVLNGSIGSAGSAVLPYSTSGNGLKDISPLSNGAPSYAGDLTTVSAVLLLKAPAKTAAGAYTATLTLTLI